MTWEKTVPTTHFGLSRTLARAARAVLFESRAGDRRGASLGGAQDAAGLITDLGGGIHYAIDSAALLADSLAGGTPYEDAMAPTVANVTGGVQSIKVNYFMRCMQITRSSAAHEGVRDVT